MEQKSKQSKQKISKAIKSFTKMVYTKVSKEKTKRHTDIKNLFKPISKKVKVKLSSPLPIKNSSAIKKKIEEIGTLDSIEKIDKAIDLFVFPTIKYDRVADYYAQKQIKGSAELLEYYHKKMNGYFGFEHPMPKKKEQSIETKPKKEDKQKYTKQIPQPVTSTLKKAKERPKIEQDNAIQVFNATATKSWILDWECVTFKEGYFIVWSPSSSNIHFKPLNVYARESTGALNYLRAYIKKKLPPIFCTIEGKHNKLIINDPVRLNEAIQVFAKEARQHAVKVKRNASTPQPSRMSFSQAMSKARQMTASDFQKYKSRFINFLVEYQDEHYKIIPCVERLAHLGSDTMEFAFMFTLKCRSGKLLIVHENINPDRSTLLFTIREDNYMKKVQSLYDFLQSAEINKRSALRSADFELNELGVSWYGSINHDEFENWSWKIRYYNNNK